MEPEKPTFLDPHELLWKARRYLWTALLPIVVMLCAAFLYLKLTVPLYESGMVISMGDRTTMSQALEPLVRGDRERESMMANVAGVQSRVRNRAFLERISQRLGLTRKPGILLAATIAAKKSPSITREEHASRIAVGILDSKIGVGPAGSGYIRIGAWDASPEEARHLASIIGEELIEDTRRGTLERVHARGEFSEDQIAVYNEKVRRSEAELRAYQESVIGRQAATGAVNENNVELTHQVIDAADEEIEQVRGRMKSDRETWAAIVGARVPIPELHGPGTTDGEARLMAMEGNYCLAAIQPRGVAEAQTRLTQIGIARRELLTSYEDAAQKLGGNLSSAARQLAAGMALDRAVLRSLQARQDRLNSLLNSYVSIERSKPRDQMELERLRNEVQTNRDLLATMQREATSSQLSEALETSQLSPRVEIVEPPVLPLYPLWPNRQKVLMGAFLFGAVCSAGLIFASERVGAIIRSVGQVEEELGAKVIGTIPRIEGWSRPGSYLANHWAPLSIVTVLLLTALVSLYATQTRDKPPTATSSELRR